MSSAPHNEAPPPLRVGLIADDAAATALAAALAHPAAALMAQGGMRQSAAVTGPAWHDDIRVLVAQNELDAIVVGTNPRTAGEIARVAFSHGMDAWIAHPAARRFDEAAALFAAARDSERVLGLESWWTHAAEHVRWALGLIDDPAPQHAEVRVTSPGPTLDHWRASAVDAGGGVLLHSAAGALEALLMTCGLPQRVQAVTTRRRRSSAAPRETEDVAAALLGYDGGRTAVISAAWDIAPFGSSTTVHHAERCIELRETGLFVRTADGRIVDERPLPTAAERLRADLATFIEQCRGRRVRPRASGAASAARATDNPDGAQSRCLALLALVETIYLSARTGQAERPAKLYEVQGWSEPTLSAR
ncbi:MAG: Gfo/Idh/MocA family oxidoreductase [Planctomycetia bacterium]|nr:MAG: Gfo/Idh/MocA family oxidoreductase [Planctomycetia bacterium]